MSTINSTDEQLLALLSTLAQTMEGVRQELIHRGYSALTLTNAEEAGREQYYKDQQRQNPRKRS